MKKRVPHFCSVSFNDELEECSWRIQLSSPFELEIGIDVASGNFCLNIEIQRFLINRSIKFEDFSHEDIIKYITLNLTREIAFYGKNNYGIFNLESIVCNSMYQYLKVHGVSNKELREIKSKDGSLLFAKLFFYSFILKEVQEECTISELEDFYYSLGESKLYREDIIPVLNETVRLNILDKIITELFTKDKMFYFKYPEYLKYIKSDTILLEWVEELIEDLLVNNKSIENLLLITEFTKRIKEAELTVLVNKLENYLLREK